MVRSGWEWLGVVGNGWKWLGLGSSCSCLLYDCISAPQNTPLANLLFLGDPHRHKNGGGATTRDISPILPSGEADMPFSGLKKVIDLFSFGPSSR